MLQMDSPKKDLNEKRMYEILTKVGSLLYERKVRQKLISEMFKAINDIEFIENKIAISKRVLRQKRDEVKEIESRLSKARVKISSIKKEKEAVEYKYLLIEKNEKDLKDKKLLLPTIESDIKYLQQEVNDLSLKFKMLELKRKESLDKKVNLKKINEDLSKKIEALLIEIPVMKNTKDVLTGIMPEGYDDDTYNALKGDFDNNLNDYLKEINGHIEKINTECLALKKEMDEAKKSKELLSSENLKLKEQLNKITSETGEHIGKEEIIARLKKLHEQKEYFFTELQKARDEVKKLEVENKNTDIELEHEKKAQIDLSQKHSHFLSIKKKMDEIENIDVEINRLSEQTKKLSFENGINKSIYNSVSEINSDIDSINNRLLLEIKKQNNQFRELADVFNLT